MLPQFKIKNTTIENKTRKKNKKDNNNNNKEKAAKTPKHQKVKKPNKKQ